ncbi:polysaccharide pyruvyl transferase family protein [Pseudomonas rustica]|uniref:polysaccharide pyruvyl transferase family protein n=1 Tax=Pseudomonas rustica TaxID=2827099 RepID=UPI001BB05A23|nr:polysaccharide pyruvyl transferase family protein [Pseudomonas rustica]MBS4085815.1 polysaccharide pyruvyl transferase family protein [Pseudomonas rustica]
MKIAIFNDTSSYHHIGCLAVSNAHDRMIAETGASIEYRHFVDEFQDLWQGDEPSTRDFIANSILADEIAAVDAVVINGEGTIHHGSGLHLLAILEYAQKLGKRTFLVNAVLQEVPIYHSVLKALDDLTVREVNSFKYLASLGIEARLVPDSIIGATFHDGVDESYRNKIIITDCHLSRDDVRQVLEQASAAFSSECVYFPLEYEDSVNDWQDALKKFRAAKLVITGRHHAVYLALLAGTPFIALPSNTWKIEGTLEQVGGLRAMWDGTDIVEMSQSAIEQSDAYAAIFNHPLLTTPLSTFANLRDSGVPKSLLDAEVYRQLAEQYFRPLSDVFFIGSNATLSLFRNCSVAKNFIASELPRSLLDGGAIDAVALARLVPRLDTDVDTIICIDAVIDQFGLDHLVSLAIKKLRPGGRLLIRCANEMFVDGFSDNAVFSKTEASLESLGLLLESSLSVRSLMAGRTERDWILSFFRSPLVKYSVAYEERNLPEFQGKSHLVDFAKHYENPWIVHSVVEIPWRVKSTAKLFKLSEQILSASSEGSADQGAALAILGWRYFESESVVEMAHWSDAVDTYLANDTSENPHVRRWCVSLNYLQARFCHRSNDSQRALEHYKRVVDAEIFSITPTLGTKQVNAAFHAGLIHWNMGEHDQAVSYWQTGMKLAFRCLGSDLLEFVGNFDRPFLFSLNDSVEIVDGAVQCASALNIVAKKADVSESFILSALENVSQSALRSAFNRITLELQACSAERVSLDERLNETLTAKKYAEDLAFARLDEINALCLEQQKLRGQLQATEDAKEYAESLAISRLAEIDTLSSNLERFDKTEVLTAENESLRTQLKLTEDAKSHAEFLAFSRLSELDTLKENCPEQIKILSAELQALRERLTLTELAKAESESLAFSRLTELDAQTARSLEQADQLSRELQSMSEQLQLTEQAKTLSESLAFSRLSEVEGLQASMLAQGQQLSAELKIMEEQVKTTGQAKAYAESLAISRLEEIDALKADQQKQDEIKNLYHENQALREQLKLTEDAKAYAEQLAVSRLSELDAVKKNEGN